MTLPADNTPHPTAETDTALTLQFARRLAVAAGRIEQDIRSRPASLAEIRFFITWADALYERAAALAPTADGEQPRRP